jgi:hypothetical protein
MKVDPLIAAAALLLTGVMAFAAVVVVEHRQARARRPPPPPEIDDDPLPPRRAVPAVPAPRLRRPPPATVEPATVQLHVHVTGPFGLVLDDVGVSVHRRGDLEDEWNDLGEAAPRDDAPEATFEALDLEPGRYDVRIQAPGMRTTQLDDLAPSPEALEVALVRAPILLGALGALGNPGSCLGARVGWSAPGQDGDDAQTGEATVDADGCTFVAEELPEPGPITVVATRRRTVIARSLVTLPLAGDPGFLCLEPPCAEEPASLLVYLADTGHHPITDARLTWTLQGSDLEGATGTAMGGGTLFVHGRRIGQTLALRAERGERAVEATTTVGTGVTEVLLTLPARPPEPDDDEGSDPGEEGYPP